MCVGAEGRPREGQKAADDRDEVGYDHELSGATLLVAPVAAGGLYALLPDPVSVTSEVLDRVSPQDRVLVSEVRWLYLCACGNAVLASCVSPRNGSVRRGFVCPGCHSVGRR